MRRFLVSAFVIFLSWSNSPLFAQSGPWISAYYAGWSQGWYNNGVLPAREIDYDAITHIIHFGLVPHADGTINSDANSIVRTNSDSLVSAAHAAGKKVLICIGGWGTDREFRSATSILVLPVFIRNLISFMRDRGYDGIDVDWEVLELSDLVQYTMFITELRAQLDLLTPRPILTAVTSWQAPIFALIHDKLDQINLMTYDLSGAWPGWVTWHNAPLYNGGYRFASNGRLVPSADAMVEEFVLAGIPRNKIGIGIDFYGYLWSGGSGTSTGGVTEPRQTWSSPPQVRMNIPYSTLIQDQYDPRYYRWDSAAQASYMSIDKPGSVDDKFISYDNEMTARMKMEYIKQKGLGGAIIWELGGGMLPGRYANRDRLLQTMKKTLQGNMSPPAPPVAPVAPLNFMRGVTLQPQIRWEPSPDASWYHLQIAYDSLFTVPIIDQQWIIETWFSPGLLSPDTTYYWRLQASTPFGKSNWTAPSTFGTAVDSFVPESWQYVSNTGDNATILLPASLVPKIGKRTLSPGDLVGLFFRRHDELVCAGYSEWNPNSNISITAWGDNIITPVKDGYSPGDTIHIKFWERKIRVENRAVPVFTSGEKTYAKDGLYVLQSLSAPADERQVMTVSAGWNMISSYIKPNDPAIGAVMEPIIPNVVLMKDGRGMVFIPDSGINTIGAWKSTEGYQIFMRTADTFAVTGETMTPESTSIPLLAGWNTIAYLRTSSLAPDSALRSLQGTLVLVKDNNGKIFWPEYGISTLSEMLPGRGYKINLAINDTLVYPANDLPQRNFVAQSTPALAASVVPMEHYPPVTGTGNSAVLLLQSLYLNDGDEIGAWSGGNVLVGTGKVLEGKCIVVLWGKDPLLKEPNGAEEGETLQLTIWKKTTGREFRLTLSSLKDGITQSTVAPTLRYESESVLIGTVTSVPFTHYLDQNFPNPFNPSTTISYGLSERVYVRLEVFNSTGQRIALLHQGVQEPGEYTVAFTTSPDRRLASGVYYCRLQAGNYSSTKKMLMLK